jgi:pilus assembly protein TadC
MLNKTFVSDALMILLVLWSLGLLLIFGVAWAIFFIYIDLKIYKRQREVELVFPDFLQLAAANINAGLPIDRALWYAIRPKFGVLAKEMELVAKSTMVGEKLDKALIQFSERYDSPNIKRALNLLLVGLESGGEIGDLLTRIAINMRETEIIKKEMASNVMTYVIFILFATLGAAPFLFALTSELIVIMNSIFSNINISEGGSFGGIGGMLTSGNSISIVDYQIFAIVSVIISSIFSAIIISVIQKGNAKEAFKKIPLYVLIGVTNYFVSYNLLHLMLGGFFK